MAIIHKTELICPYEWRPVLLDDPRISGEPDMTLFNRNNGPEVLFIINYFADKNNITDLCGGLKLEKIIREDLPGIYRTQLHAIQWLKNNWKLF